MKINNLKLAFTLVELMVVVAIVMVLTGVGAASLNRFNNNQKLEGAKEELIADLKLARNLAITNQVPAGSGYVLVSFDSGVVSVSAESGGESEDYFSKSNEAISGISDDFGFGVETGQLTDDSGILASGNLCLDLYLVGNESEKKYIEINSSGLIYEKDVCP